jgi:hypothetical protein
MTGENDLEEAFMSITANAEGERKQGGSHA